MQCKPTAPRCRHVFTATLKTFLAQQFNTDRNFIGFKSWINQVKCPMTERPPEQPNGHSPSGACDLLGLVSRTHIGTFGQETQVPRGNRASVRGKPGGNTRSLPRAPPPSRARAAGWDGDARDPSAAKRRPRPRCHPPAEHGLGRHSELQSHPFSTSHAARCLILRSRWSALT